MKWTLWTVGVVVLASMPGSGWGAVPDHLQCFNIKDTTAKATYTANLTPTDNTFPVANGCVVRVPAKLLCVDVAKTIVPPPTPPGAGPGLPAQKYLCYKVKCPKATPTATIQDQFGTHQVTVKGTSLLCAPEPAPTTTTSTTTTTTSTSTTTTTTMTCSTVTNLGCYTEASTGRALSGASFSSASMMSVEACQAFCSGYKYFGLEYSQECYCGQSLASTSVPAPASDCNMACSGNSAEICGGPNRLSLYSCG